MTNFLNCSVVYVKNRATNDIQRVAVIRKNLPQIGQQFNIDDLRNVNLELKNHMVFTVKSDASVGFSVDWIISTSKDGIMAN